MAAISAAAPGRATAWWWWTRRRAKCSSRTAVLIPAPRAENSIRRGITLGPLSSVQSENANVDGVRAARALRFRPPILDRQFDRSGDGLVHRPRRLDRAHPAIGLNQ